GVGLVREIPYEELFVGKYETDDPETWSPGELGHVVDEMGEATHRESEKPDNNFFNGNTRLEVEQWSPILKKITMQVDWEEVPEGSTTGDLVENTLKKEIYIHENSDYSLLE
ncbi:MAG: hypothetical protein OES12_01715, partial [Anaerolineae bacterium]|nr:hypothetical protein [Anaerolineae bacterium]